MHAAPSVSYPVGRSAFAGWLHGGGAVAGLAVAILWTVQSGTFGWRQALALGAALACAALAAGAWLRSATGVLRWDGARWSWQDGAATGCGRPELALDLQSRLLVQWRSDGAGTCWLWLEKRSAPADWEALRRAVYSRASTPVPPAGEPPAAEQ